MSNVPSQKSEFGLLSLIVLAALALRLDFLLASRFIIDSDEAIVGLMAKHIVEGKPWPIFFYGQSYMGSFEAFIAALIFRYFGISSAGLKAAPLIVSLLLVPVIYYLTKEFGSRRAAWNAALLMALPPSALVVWSSMARGGFIEVVLCGALAILFTLKFLKKERASKVLIAVVYFFLGFGWWTNNQVIYFAVPITFYILIYLLRRCISKLEFVENWVVAINAFVLGSLPYWYFNLKNNFSSFKIFGRASASQIVDSLNGIYHSALPILLGAKRFWHNEEVFPGAVIIALAIYSSICLVTAWTRRKELLDLLSLRLDYRRPVTFFLVFIFASLAIFACSSFGWLVQAPRYLLPLYVGIFPLVGIALADWWAKSQFFGGLLLAILLAFNLASSYLGGRALQGQPIIFREDRVSKDNSELISKFAERGWHLARSNYWIGYRLAFESKEEIVFDIFGEPRDMRLPKYRERVAKAAEVEVPYILSPRQFETVEEALKLMGVKYQREVLSDYIVLSGVNTKLPSDWNPITADRVVAVSSFNPDQAGLAIDGDLATRWGSATPQNSRMQFEIEFVRPENVRGFSIDLGKWSQDYPRELQVEAEMKDGRREVLLTPQGYASLRYFLDKRTDAFVQTDLKAVRKIILKQLGSHPIFDWSIAEFKVYQ